jgi:hypothetical protein
MSASEGNALMLKMEARQEEAKTRQMNMLADLRRETREHIAMESDDSDDDDWRNDDPFQSDSEDAENDLHSQYSMRISYSGDFPDLSPGK